MYQKLKKSFAKIALTALAIQMAVMLAPTGAHAAVFAGVVQSFTLYNATTNTPIMDIANGAKINMALPGVGTNLNIVANTLPSSVGSVKFVLTGAEASTRTENTAPYALKGDNPTGEFLDWTPTLGLYNVVATPYELGGGVNPGTPAQVNFTIYNDPTAPVATSVASGSYLLNEDEVATNNPLNVNIAYSEIMDIGSTPTLTFSSDISSSVDCIGTWTDGQNYDYTCTLTDADVEISGVTATVTGAKDLAGNLQVPYLLPATLDIDTKAPMVTTSFKPTTVTSLGKVVDVYFSANEKMIVGNFTFQVDGSTYPVDPTPVKADNTDLALFHSVQIPANFFAGATTSLTLGYTATDKFGNSNPGSVIIPVDTEAPDKVENLVATVNADGSVVLSWTNPLNDYTRLQVTRDGVALANLPVGTTTYTDSSVTRGTTYSYTVIAFDAAGHETMAAPVQITVPGIKVAAVVSDSTNYTDTTAKDSGTITSATNSADTKGDKDEDKEDGLPFWAIVLLVVLAAVGGYLIYNQKPVATPVVPVVKKTTPAPKKTTPKKKPTTKTKK